MLLRSLIFALGAVLITAGVVFVYWPAALILGGLTVSGFALLSDDGRKQ